MSARRAKCDNCRRVSAEEKLKPIEDYFQRVGAGGVVPLGECPHCGALAYLVTPKEPTARDVLKSAARALARANMRFYVLTGEHPAYLDAAERRIAKFLKK